MTMDLFPLGHAGVALERMETNRREFGEEGRLPMMEDVITALSCVGTLWMIKMIATEIRHSHALPQRISSFCGWSCV